jgi:hypothetical protein
MLKGRERRKEGSDSPLSKDEPMNGKKEEEVDKNETILVKESASGSDNPGSDVSGHVAITREGDSAGERDDGNLPGEGGRGFGKDNNPRHTEGRLDVRDRCAKSEHEIKGEVDAGLGCILVECVDWYGERMVTDVGNE